VSKRIKQLVPKLEKVAPGFDVPKFTSDEEELQWLEKNHQQLARLAEKHGVAIRFVQKEPTRQISIRLPVRDIERAKKIAAARKERYQTVLKRALRRGLTKTGN
jgi:predicted DNA binding CopG/RHH family protein